MKHRNTVSAVVFALILLPCMSFAQTGERAVNINPVGVLFQGLSYVEYEYMIAPTVSIAARLDNFRYKYNEKETNYTYDEKGNGFGLGGGVRFYFRKNGSGPRMITVITTKGTARRLPSRSISRQAIR